MVKIYEKPNELAQYRELSDFIGMTPMKANQALRHIKTGRDIVASALGKETPTINQLKIDRGENVAVAYVGLWITDLNMALGVKRIMGKEQIQECSFYILEDYRYLTIADFKLFFSGIKKGKAGEMYEAISMAKILTWLQEYVIERERNFESAEDSRHYKSNEQRVREIKQTGSIKEISESLELRKKLGK